MLLRPTFKQPSSPTPSRLLASPRRPLSRQPSLGLLLVFGGHNQQRHGALAGHRHLAGRQRPGDRGRERTPGGVRQELEQGSRARRLIGDLFLGAEAAAIRPFRSGVRSQRGVLRKESERGRFSLNATVMRADRPASDAKLRHKV